MLDDLRLSLIVCKLLLFWAEVVVPLTGWLEAIPAAKLLIVIYLEATFVDEGTLFEMTE